MDKKQIHSHVSLLVCGVLISSIVTSPFALADKDDTNGQRSRGQELRTRIEQATRQYGSADRAKDAVLESQLTSSGSRYIGDVLRRQGVPTGDVQKASDSIARSFQKWSTKEYRIFVRSALGETEIVTNLSMFDSVTVKKVSDETDGSTYEVRFSATGRMANKLGRQLMRGMIPTNLLEGISIIEPVALKAIVSTGSYLVGESVSSMWGQTKTKATDYQYGLSLQNTVKVGVIDTGIMLSHPDLAVNIAKNAKEIAGNGLDDDGNGYVDDVSGYNFVAGTNNANDDQGHGTHVAGIIGGAINGKGVFGMNSKASLVPLKVLSANGYGSSYDIVDAINYAANNGISVVNLSLGGNGNPATDMLCTAITNARTKGTLSVVAAGNENSDVSGKVPAGCKNALTVGAVDSNLAKASFSNYGAEVDVSAPGVGIYSSYYNGSYVQMSGTSMATPFVAGLAAAIKAHKPTFGPTELFNAIKNDAATTSVTSSLNIGRFIQMDKAFTNLGIPNDVLFGSGTTGTGSTWSGSTGTGSTWSGTTGSGTVTPPTTGTGSSGSGSTGTGVVTPPPAVNIAPTVVVTSSKTGTNSYVVSASGSDRDGTITNYSYYNGSALLASGAGLKTLSITVTQNTTITVKVTDNAGASASASVSLAYAAPTTPPPATNIAPALTLATSKLAKANRLTINTSDTDGKVAKIEIYVNGVYLYYAYPNVKSFIGYLDFVKSKSYTVKVVSIDNLGAKTEKTVTVK